MSHHQEVSTPAWAESHPRPQFARQHWIDLCGTWQFAYDDADIGRNAGWMHDAAPFDREIIVPFPPESPASGINDTGFHPVLWYRRTFHAPQAAGELLLLHCGAIDYSAEVWVNGALVAAHQGGHTPFSADITWALRNDLPEQVIVIRAEDQAADLTQPRGKQYWEAQPSRIWYHRTSGIWQPVWLEPLPQLHFADVRWTPNAEQSRIGLQLQLNRAPQHPVHIRVHLSMHGTTLADDTYTLADAELSREIVLTPHGMLHSTRELLWSPDHPNLIDATLTLTASDGTTDTLQSYIGLRSVGVANGRFLLNDRPFYLRMVLEQGYWPASHLAAPDAAALRHEVELIKALGFNGVRIHQKVEDPRFLYWCDRLGVVVWGEMANAYVFSATAVARLTREWMEVLQRDYSHPCIIAWVPLNESWGVPNLERTPAQQEYVRSLYHLTRALDPTRPVIGNDGWENLAGDILGIHDYAPNGTMLLARYGSSEAIAHTLREVQPSFRSIVLPEYAQRGQPVMLTEFGGISYAPQAGQAWFGYGTVDSQEAYLARYEELISAILACPAIVGFCYTQLTDTVQETNGLLSETRVPKLDPAAIRAITQRPSGAVPGEVMAKLRATLLEQQRTD
ncbi:MAG TPA: glycoside hydrolase family 2 TIM barrel-domain containing protein [Roseiflexaceae bacterium]|nr:glycoside hydrolase family 2 TIM barrel-domain containing protein [Roseiflexaceae bacterium]HMP41977.1 glycoside hydrolase family 2 TIM barrel-domain containing protein [Roseiflexaceae bacterium]